jgi:Flp pilus assembly protein TadD
VVEASHVFREENRDALTNSRTRLLVADGRSHLQLTSQQYDVIISEPSNPWIAGVAALFTREVFEAARGRLAPGGIMCQWANAYNISDRDLRSIVSTFQAVFPHSTAWLVGADDVVLIGSDASLDGRLRNIERQWSRPGVTDDLARVGAVTPFALWSLYVAGPNALRTYGREGEVLTDDRMALEFSAPRELGSRRPGSNAAALRALFNEADVPDVIRHARATAGAVEWRQRAAMMAQRDAFTDAFDDYVHAFSLDRADAGALDGLVRMAILTRRPDDALRRLEQLSPQADRDSRVLVARARLLAARGAHADAVGLVHQALELGDADEDGLSQLAALHADTRDIPRLTATVRRMRERMPTHGATVYYAAVAAFLDHNVEEARRLAQHALAVDPSYAAAYDLLGAALVQLGDHPGARAAFMKSLSFDAHDSSAYANLGVLALENGDAAAAIDYFAEALWLDAESALAREGLRRAQATLSEG